MPAHSCAVMATTNRDHTMITEADYIAVTNLARIRLLQAILQSLTEDDGRTVSQEEVCKMGSIARAIEARGEMRVGNMIQ